MTECDGQLDVYEVLKLVEEEGAVPDKARPLRVDVVLDVSRNDTTYSYVVRTANADALHVATFYSQAECWAFVKGYELALKQGAPI